MRLLVLGPPGSGKGTQAAILSDKLGVPHISTGEMFRKAIRNGSELGLLAQNFIHRGELVPDGVTIALVRERLGQEDCRAGYLLDGFPRTVEQGRAFDNMLNHLGQTIDRVIYLDVPITRLIQRLTARRVCGVCGSVYHMENKKPKTEGICDQCGGPVEQRDDDSEETVLNRLDVYNQMTKPLAGFYQEKDLLCSVSGDLSIEETTRIIFQSCLRRDN